MWKIVIEGAANILELLGVAVGIAGLYFLYEVAVKAIKGGE